MKAIFDRIADAYAAFNQRDIDRALSALVDRHLQHVYSLRDGLVSRMEIAPVQAAVDRRDPQSN
jgi:hypothetical protein